MKTVKWLNDIINKGLLCEEYTEKVNLAHSKKQIFDICADSNGISFLAEMREKGYPLSYDTIKEEFEKYLNGRYKPMFTTPMGGSYSSSIYCDYDKECDIVVDTTVCSLLSCHNEVWVQQFNYTRIVLDQECDIKLYCPINARAVVEVYGDAKVEVVEGIERVKIRRK